MLNLLKINKSEKSVTDPRHPFWSLTTGSVLTLRLIDGGKKCMVITVHTVSEPYVYETYTIMENGNKTASEYHKKKRTIKLIKNGWMQHHADRTNVDIEEHKNITPPRMVIHPVSDDESPRSLSNERYDSAPPSPNPSAMRKDSLKGRLKSIGKNRETLKMNKRSLDDSNGLNNSNSNLSNVSSLSTSSKSVSIDGSSEVSPRSVEVSPRKGRLFMKRSPRSTSEDSTEKSSQNIGDSPDTSELLRKAALKLSGNNNTKEDNDRPLRSSLGRSQPTLLRMSLKNIKKRNNQSDSPELTKSSPSPLSSKDEKNKSNNARTPRNSANNINANMDEIQ